MDFYGCIEDPVVVDVKRCGNVLDKVVEVAVGYLKANWCCRKNFSLENVTKNSASIQ